MVTITAEKDKGVYIHIGDKVIPYGEYIERWLNGEEFTDWICKHRRSKRIQR